jgi:hypothetical protein
MQLYIVVFKPIMIYHNTSGPVVAKFFYPWKIITENMWLHTHTNPFTQNPGVIKVECIKQHWSFLHGTEEEILQLKDNLLVIFPSWNSTSSHITTNYGPESSFSSWHFQEIGNLLPSYFSISMVFFIFLVL